MVEILLFAFKCLNSNSIQSNNMSLLLFSKNSNLSFPFPKNHLSILTNIKDKFQNVSKKLTKMKCFCFELWFDEEESNSNSKHLTNGQIKEIVSSSNTGMKENS